VYGRPIAELKPSGDLGRGCRCRPSPYLNNIVEQDHRFIKNGSWRVLVSGLRKGRGGQSKVTRQCTLIRKGQIPRLPKGDVIGQRQFIHTLFGIAV